MDILEEARVALLFQRARLERFGEMSADTVLRLATLGGAEALNIDGEVGSLEVGKFADLAAFPLRDAAPVHDPLVAAAFALAGTPASFVAVAGRILVGEGALVGRDPSLGERVQYGADMLRDWLQRQ
jgi:5-methylthioadenosine/S-adenosylhomocysteine deaminase